MIHIIFDSIINGLILLFLIKNIIEIFIRKKKNLNNFYCKINKFYILDIMFFFFGCLLNLIFSYLN